MNASEGSKFVIPSFKVGDTVVGPPVWGAGKVLAVFTKDTYSRFTVEYIIQPDADAIPPYAYKLIQTFTSATREDAER